MTFDKHFSSSNVDLKLNSKVQLKLCIKANFTIHIVFLIVLILV